ncbi:MAG: hypothetical protein VXZ27_05575, partial [SAR324 cluster bacterium]|nr:hypothetical protein [SAR324 cluster bacterium]
MKSKQAGADENEIGSGTTELHNKNFYPVHHSLMNLPEDFPLIIYLVFRIGSEDLTKLITNQKS